MIAFPYLIHQYIPTVAQASIQAIIQIELKINPSATGLDNSSKLQYTTHNFHIGFHNGYVHKVYITAPKILLALNDNSDIPPIVGNNNIDNKLKNSSPSNISKDSTADISPYRSRSLLYIQQRKPTPNELNEFKGAWDHVFKI